MTLATTHDASGELHRLISLMTGDEKHSAAATSTLDVLWVLYTRVLEIDPHHLSDPLRDRFYLSKGHGPMAYYAVLAARGFIDESLLTDWAAFDSPLGRHPDRLLVPGVEGSSGSLGHGLGMAVGAALALRARHRAAPRVFCLLGDGELDEGSNHEAIQFAGRVGLDRLTAIIVDNQSSTHGWPGGVGLRFEAEGWTVDQIDGTDHEEIVVALADRPRLGPHAVVARIPRRW
jgi:transketolase